MVGTSNLGSWNGHCIYIYIQGFERCWPWHKWSLVCHGSLWFGWHRSPYIPLCAHKLMINHPWCDGDAEIILNSYFWCFKIYVCGEIPSVGCWNPNCSWFNPWWNPWLHRELSIFRWPHRPIARGVGHETPRGAQRGPGADGRLGSAQPAGHADDAAHGAAGDGEMVAICRHGTKHTGATLW